MSIITTVYYLDNSLFKNTRLTAYFITETFKDFESTLWGILQVLNYSIISFIAYISFHT